MKRIIFCFDGTWNQLHAEHPTNVVLIAESIFPRAKDGTPQIIHYDDGVGTGGDDFEWKQRFEQLTGGVFGWGLLDNIREAYRFLIFNYEPGDEIYAFGFSRGAYTARSFVGLLRCASILTRNDARRINEAIEHYRSRLIDDRAQERALAEFRARHASELVLSDEEDRWRSENVENHVIGTLPKLTIRYLGLWDTVGAMGLPSSIPGAGRFNARHQFHDTDLPDFLESGRHALAIDERRRTFLPTAWENVDERNAQMGFAIGDPKAPLQQQWFPGTHGSVGGGGERRGLSDAALAWVVQGAVAQGIELDTRTSSRVYTFSPDHREHLYNNPAGPGLMERWFPKKNREGPAALHEVHPSARRRWMEPAHRLPEGRRYRPWPLHRVASELDRLTALRAAAYEAPHLALHTVQRGETLGSIADKHYGDAQLYRWIFEANRHLLDDPNIIYVGDELVIPIPPHTGPDPSSTV